MQRMKRQELDSMIQRELSAAERARREGNEGKVRVCARRAVGLAITYWLQDHPEHQWGADAMTQLHALQNEPSVPANVREAAGRLSARVSADFTALSSIDPLVDCTTITDYLLSSRG